MTTKFARIALTMAAAPLAMSTATADVSPYHRMNFKEQQALGIDKGRVAVFRDAQAGAADAKAGGQNGTDIAWEAADVLLANPEPLPINGWKVGHAPGSDWDTQQLESYVAAAGESGLVDFVSPVFIDEKGDPLYVTRDILVRFQPDVSRDQAVGILDAHVGGLVLDEDFADTPNLFRVRSLSKSGFDVLAQANTLAELPQVKYAEPDYLLTVQPTLVPNDPFYPSQWALNQTNDFDLDAPEAWDTTTGNPAITVVVMDCGVQLNHPDLNAIPGATFIPGQGSVDGAPGSNCDNHGTWVAGYIAARINNSTGVVGIAPNCRVAPAYVFAVDTGTCGPGGIGPTGGFVNALAWAQSSGARVTNTSLNIPSVSTLSDKYADTQAAGIVHFAATGNSGGVGVGYPASLSVVVGVGAIASNGNRAGFSTYGPGIDLVAPGQGVMTTDRSGGVSVPGDYFTGDGTSFASPYAAGVAALMLSVNASLSATQVQFIMQQTAVDRGPVGYDTQYGYGIANARAALNWVLNPPPAPGNFNLVAPADEATGVSRTPVFVWSAAPSVLDYTITVDDDSSFVNPEIVATTASTSLPSPVTLEPGRTYFWSVVARNLVGTTPSNPLLGNFRTILDCNLNGINDAVDIAGGTPDCNENGIPDSCDIASGNYRYKTIDYSPIEATTPQAIVIENVPPANGPVSLGFNALSDLNTESEFFSIDLDGVGVGDVYNPGFNDCAANQLASLVVPAATWNAARLNNSMTINVVPSLGVSLPLTCPLASYVNVTVTYSAGPLSTDADQNNVPDECAATCLCADSNCDGQVSVGDIGFFVTAVSQGQAAWAAQFPGGNPSCSFLCGNDVNGDNAVTVSDIGGFVQAITGGGCP